VSTPRPDAAAPPRPPWPCAALDKSREGPARPARCDPLSRCRGRDAASACSCKHTLFGSGQRDRTPNETRRPDWASSCVDQRRGISSWSGWRMAAVLNRVSEACSPLLSTRRSGAGEDAWAPLLAVVLDATSPRLSPDPGRPRDQEPDEDEAHVVGDRRTTLASSEVPNGATGQFGTDRRENPQSRGGRSGTEDRRYQPRRRRHAGTPGRAARFWRGANARATIRAV
jgi:hypothetical protein